MPPSRTKRKIRFRLRPQGQVFAITTVLVMLAAINTGANLLYIVVGGLISFLVISRVLGAWSLQNLQIRRDAPEAVHRDQHFLATIRMENHKRLIPCMSIRIATESEPHLSAGYILKIPKQRAAVLRISQVFHARGVHLLPAIHIISTFPLGLFEARLTFSDSRAVVVYPRVFTARIGMLEHKPGTGDAPRVARGDGDEFFALREYMPGDDVRKINWRASARLNTLIVKELEPDTARYIAILLDNRAYDIEDFNVLFEEAVETAASLAVTLLNQQLRVGMSSYSGSVQMGEGSLQILKVLDFLARINPVKNPEQFIPDIAEGHRAAVACVSANPELWGRRSREFDAPVVHPKEVVRA